MSDEEIETIRADEEEEIEKEGLKRKRKRRQRLVVDEDPRKTKKQMIIYSLIIFISLILPMVVSIPMVFLEVESILSFVVAVILMIIGIGIAAIVINFKILAEPNRNK